MYNLTKISLGAKVCVATKETIPVPVVVPLVPACPFNFILGCEAFSSAVGDMVHQSTCWEISSTNTFNEVIYTTITTDNKVEAKIPKKLLKENTTYYARAYFITNYGESNWSEVVTINTKVTNLTPEVYKQLSNSFIYTVEGETTTQIIKQLFITLVNNRKFSIAFNENNKKIEVYELVSDTWTLRGSSEVLVGDYCGVQLSGSQSINPFTFFTTTSKIYFVTSLITAGDPITVNNYVCYEFDITTNTLTNLINDTTLTNLRERTNVVIYNDTIYFVGGIKLNTTGVVNDTDINTYFIKYDKQTTQFSNVEQLNTGPLKLSNGLVVIKDDILYVLRSKEVLSLDYNNYKSELWKYSFTTKLWEQLPNFYDMYLFESEITDMTIDESKENLIFINNSQNEALIVYTFNLLDNIWNKYYISNFIPKGLNYLLDKIFIKEKKLFLLVHQSGGEGGGF